MNGNKGKKSIDAIRVKRRARSPRSFVGDNAHVSLSVGSTPIKIDKIRTKTRKNKISQNPVISNNNIFSGSISKKSKKQPLDFIRTLFQNKIAIIGLKLLMVLSALVFFFHHREKTIITIRPHYQYADVNNTVKAYRNPKESQLGFDIIAITDKTSVAVSSDKTRTVTKKASGEVTLYNNFSTVAQRLLPNTRFESVDGKIFMLGNNEVLIPGKTDTQPGSLNVIVYAEKPGEEYNIDETDFVLPGFKEAGLTNKYKDIYATSTSSMTGGFVGLENYVGKEQEEKIEQELITELQKRLRQKIATEKTENVLLVSGGESFILKDTVSNSGMLSKEGTILGIVIGKDILARYIANNYLVKSQDQEVALNTIGNTTIAVKNGEIVDFRNLNSLDVVIDGASLYSWRVDTKEIRTAFTDTAKTEISKIFNDVSSVDRGQVKVRPFWKKNTAQNGKNIKIIVE